jgi:RHS repeat-associated protein
MPVVSVLAALSLLAGVLTAVGVFSGPGGAPAASAGQPVAVHPVSGRTVKVAPMPAAHREPVSWPAAGSGIVAFTARTVPAGPAARMTAGPTAGSAQAGDLPVWVGQASGSGPVVAARPRGAATRGPGSKAAVSGSRAAVTSALVSPPASAPAGTVKRAAVSVAPQPTAAAAGIRGVVFTVARADGSAAAGRVHVSLNYATFAGAYGGGYAGRLHLVELPACALTTPHVPACRRQVAVISANDVRASRVGADVILPGVSASASVSPAHGGGGTVLTAKTGPASAAGLVLAATASSQGAGGNFGVEPLSEENQWVTGGSSGAYSYSYPVNVPPVPGGLEPSVSLDYSSQTVDGLNASTNNEASSIGDGWTYQPGFIENDYPTCATIAAIEPDTLDLCAAPPEQTLTLNGVTTPLVVTSGGAMHPEADGGQQVLQTSTGYEVIEPDGTQYWFGVNQLPGYASGDQQTNSLWTVPVWQSGRFTTATWRYMLDYVVDAQGNAIAYFYNTQTNYYAEGNGSTEGTIANGAYTQGGALAKIEYGLRANGNIYAQTPAAQVTFTSTTSRQDAPDDLACASGAACSVNAPTFWTDYALTGITTQALVNGSLSSVDSWALAQTYPATGDPTTSPSLWLSSITRTGQDGTTPITLPPVSFSGTAMPNLAAGSPGAKQGDPLITRFRLTSITNEYGGVSTVKYSAADSSCASGSFPKDYSNAGLCYPAYWWTAPLAGTYQEDWFNLYDVSSVTDADTTGGDPPVVTSYGYSGPGWHYDNDTISRSANWTWDQWRGFRSVTTQTGTAPDPVTQTTDTYFQGMSDDQSDSRYSGGTITNGTVSLTSSHGDVVDDSDQYAGMKFEQITYNGAGTGAQVADTIWIPYTSAATGSSSSLYQASYITGTSATDTYTSLSGGGTRESTITNTYNGYGQVLTESSVPDTTDPAQSTCTSTTYVVNTASTVWIVDKPEDVTITSGACGSYKPAIVSDTQYQYDGQRLGFTPAQGNLTQVNHFAATASGATVSEQYTYDEYGRVLTSADADQRTTTTAYTPATGAEPASVKVTDPAGLSTTTTYDPARDLPTGVADPAGYQTAETYDALGRETAAWTPGNPTSGPPVDKYSYTVSNTAPSVTTEQAEQPGGGYTTTDTINDSFGQVRETQTQTAGGGTDVTDVSYNSDGWKALTSDPYYISGAPSGTLVAAASSTVPSQTGYVYDGDGRVLKQISYALGSETWETDTSYGGNYVTTVPPTGGTSQTTFSDGRGLTTAIYQYHAGVSASPADPSSDYDKTSYTYTLAQQLASITDTANNTWSYTYDQLGNQLTQTDPDAGKSASTYDNAGQLMSVTDARNKATSYTYDLDGRKIAAYDTTGGALESTATQLASWAYDSLAKGKLTSSTSYSGGASYTEQVTGYNAQGLASGTATIIPAAQGALAGTYTASYTYAPDGQQVSYTDSAAGGLPAETVTTGHDAAGNPNSLTGTTSTSTTSYVGSLSYTNLGQPLQYQMGSSSQPAYITASYDPQTGRLTEQNTQTGTAKTSVDDLHYTYDQVGNVTSEADTPSGVSGATDVQCFQYDYLGRLTQAWAQGNTGCPSSPSASAEGGAAPYWNAYTYNSIGNLTGITATTPTGAVSTTTASYPAAGAAQPHAVAAAKVTTGSGTTSTSYVYDPAGNLTTVSGTAQSQALTWNDAGQLTQDAVTPAGGTAKNTTYTYDAAGALLLTSDPGTTTLYLPDEELSLNTGTGTVTGTRYYSLGGTTVAARTGATSLAYLAGDQQATESDAIDAATLNLTRRYFDPYGNPRGTVPSSFPAGQKGFVGGTADTTTGLTNLGAREYQPGTGSFISPDPMLKPYNPQDLNPYAYALGNPSTYSDPSGLCTPGQDGCPGTYTGAYGCRGSSQQMVNQCVANQEQQQARGSHTDATANCPPTPHYCSAPQQQQIFKPLPHHHHTKTGPAKKAATTGEACTRATEFGRFGPIEGPSCPAPVPKGDSSPLPILKHVLNAGIAALGGIGWVVCKGDEYLNEAPAESFTADTLVVLASGAAIPIADLKLREKVLATNTKTGKTQPETVVAVLTHHDTDLYDLTIRSGARTAVIRTTRNHPFWDRSVRAWVKAAAIHAGDRLRTSDGAVAVVVGGYTPKQATGWMWDLTVEGDHDFYVDTIAADVLVHNASGPAASQVPNLAGMTQTQADKILSQYGFELRSISESGAYARYVAPDGSEIWIRLSDGRVTRTSKIDAGPNAKNRTQRWDPEGNPTDSHNTGENLSCE